MTESEFRRAMREIDERENRRRTLKRENHKQKVGNLLRLLVADQSGETLARCATGSWELSEPYLVDAGNVGDAVCHKIEAIFADNETGFDEGKARAFVARELAPAFAEEWNEPANEIMAGIAVEETDRAAISAKLAELFASENAEREAMEKEAFALAEFVAEYMPREVENFADYAAERLEKYLSKKGEA